jgi:integrase
MPAKTPKLPHVRFTRVKGKTYAYFDSGRRKPNGRPVYLPMPPIGSAGFYDSYASLKGARAKLQAFQYTVADLVRDYEKSKTYRDLKPRSQTVYSSSLRKVIEFLGEYPMNDLTSEDVQAMLENDIEGAGTHNNVLAAIGVIYAWARSPAGGRKTTLKPTEGISKRKGGEHKPWPDDVVETALVCDDADVRLAVHLLYFTGQRIGDVLKMRWSDIRDDVIEVTQEKTGKTVWIPFLSELREELARTPKRGLTIMAGERGHPRGEDRVRKELQAFTRVQGAETVPHGLRKNAVNSLLLAGCTVAETASITGQTYKVVEHYAKLINQRRMASAAILKLEGKRQSKRNSA